MQATLLKSKSAYSLIEMIVVLAITSLVMVALVNLMASIMRISASNTTRGKAREDLANLVQEFEKDLRNASKVSNCSGSGSSFICEIYTSGYYRWRSCPRVTTNVCNSISGRCDLKNATYTMCKYALSASGVEVGQPLVKFNDLYNLEQFQVNSVITPATRTESSNRVIAFTALVSHPNAGLNINNVVRQSIVSTRNFDRGI